MILHRDSDRASLSDSIIMIMIECFDIRYHRHLEPASVESLDLSHVWYIHVI
jgi:hypothetical protein